MTTSGASPNALLHSAVFLIDQEIVAHVQGNSSCYVAVCITVK